jgi:hypothetical protein
MHRRISCGIHPAMLAADCSESLGGLFFQLLARKLFVGRR